MGRWGAFSKEMTIELSSVHEDLGDRRKSRSVNGFEGGKEQEVRKVGWSPTRPECLNNSNNALLKGVKFEQG